LLESVLVSVVIPTRRRPRWVVCAIKSALAQSHGRLEVIVVVDGSDPETGAVLSFIDDERLRVIELPENAGGSEARNTGVREARGEWVAFLDDDDEWVPEKLEKQLEVAARGGTRYLIVSSKLLAHGFGENRILPRRLYATGENVAEYLFCRTGLSYCDGMLQTSTLLIKRSLLLEVPFQKGLKRHQDWDWLLKVATRRDVEIVMLPEALTRMRIAERNDNVSQSGEWEDSLVWAKMARPLMSTKAYSYFIATECVPRARKCRVSPAIYVRLLRECLWLGRPGLRQSVLFFCFCIMPRGIKKKFRRQKVTAVSAEQWRAYN
jgi:glycosyltransferase involved in cell wall biosynthesis